MVTKPRGVWATFDTECIHCRAEVTVTNGKPEPHQCEQPISLADIRASLASR